MNLNRAIYKLRMKYNSNRDVLWRAFISLLPIFILLFFIVLKFKFRNIYVQIVGMDDSIIEDLQVVFYFIAAILALLITKSFLNVKYYLIALIYCILFLGFLFICLEEISWGQRIFNIQYPTSIIANNYQEECNLHNLNIIEPYIYKIYIGASAFCAFAWLIIPVRRRTKLFSMSVYIIPDKMLILYFLPTFAIFLYFDYMGIYSFGLNTTGFIHVRDQEVVELLLSLGFLFFMMLSRYRQIRQLNFECGTISKKLV